MSHQTAILTEPADLRRWDEAVRTRAGGHFRQYSWWRDSLAAAGLPGQILATRRGGEFVAGAVLLEFGLRGMRIFTVVHGPCAFEADAAEIWLAALHEHARRRGAILVQFNAVPEGPALAAIAAGPRSGRHETGLIWDVYRSPDPFCAVPLAGKTSEQVWQGFNQSTRRKVRTAEKAGVVVTTAASTEDVVAAHTAWQETARRRGFDLRPLESCRRAVEGAAGRDSGVLLMARVGDETAAAIFVAFDACEAHYIWGGFDERFSEQAPNHVLHWHALQMAVTRGLRSYNLGNYVEGGNGRFKLGFGGEVGRIGHSSAWILRPWAWRCVRALLHPRVRGRLRTVYRRLRGFGAPRPIAQDGD